MQSPNVSELRVCLLMVEFIMTDWRSSHRWPGKGASPFPVTHPSTYGMKQEGHRPLGLPMSPENKSQSLLTDSECLIFSTHIEMFHPHLNILFASFQSNQKVAPPLSCFGD